MPVLVIRNEAGDRFEALAECLKATAVETLPLVERVTGLPLPDPVVIRTMTVRNWTRAHRRSMQERLLAEAQQLHPSREEMHAAAVMRMAMLKAQRTFWPLTGGETVMLTPGQPEVLILPQALEHAGRLDDTPFLSKLLAHEQTRLAQYAASEGEVRETQQTFFPDLRGVTGRAYDFLMQGHAGWADRQITARLFSEPVPNEQVTARASARYRDLFATPQHQKAAQQARQAGDSVARIITAEGLAHFNQVWKNPDLVPTIEETTSDLAAWQKRFARPGVTA